MSRLIKEKVPYKVLLPESLKEGVTDIEVYKRMVLAYMKRYPHYRVIGIKNGFAVCERD